jgi:hypothetical protein
MKFKKLAAILMLVIFVTSCAAFMPQLPQTPQDKSAFFMSYYMAQLKDYDMRYESAMVVPPTDFEVKIIEIKYEFLQRAWKPIAIFDGYVASGTIPPVGLEEEINALIGILESQLQEGS